MEGKNNEVKGQNIEQFEIRLMSAMLFCFCHDPLTISRERSNFPRSFPLFSSNKRPRLDLPTSRTLNFFTGEKRER